MSIIEKHVLPHKINKLTIKLKSYAFMKIFMTIDNPIQPKSHKIRHYDLELEGATAISGWIKKKLQQVYLRGFLEIKDTQPELVSLKYLKEPPSPPQIEKLNFKNSSVKSTGKFINSDRSQNEKIKMPSYSTQQLLEKSSMEKVEYRSEYGGSNLGNKMKKERQNQKQEDNKKSNLMSLLDKVRKVNSQSKQDKENYERNEPIYGLSYENSRVMSSHSAYGSNDLRWNDKGRHHMKEQQTARLNTANSQYNNDMSFCAYGQTERVNSINNLKSIRNNHCANRQPQRVSENYTPVTYELMNIEQEESMDKNNLMSLRKWHKNQKRNIIMEKINELEKSLQYADNSSYQLQEEYYYNNNNYNDEIYTSRDYYEIPMGNYSQGYLNMRTERQPVRSVVEVRVRK